MMTSDSSISHNLESENEVLFEKILLNIPECFVYQIPPLRSAAGFRAEEWNLANPIMTGFLRIYQSEAHVRIVLYRYINPGSRSTSDDNLALFAECPVDIKPKEGIARIVDEVYDSSRYFVLRIKDPKSSKTIRLGIGFTERETAFDFRCCLNECIRYVDRLEQAGKRNDPTSTSEEENEDQLNELKPVINQLHDLIIKEGQKIKIPTTALGVRLKERDKSHPMKESISSSPTTTTNKKILIAPPRSIHDPVSSSSLSSSSSERNMVSMSSSNIQKNNESVNDDNSNSVTINEDVEWGDFNE